MQVNIETEPDTSIPTVTLHVPVDYPETAALTAALKNLSIEAATLTVSQRGQLVQLPLTSILFIEATGHQVAAHTLDNVYRVPKSLTAVGTGLPTYFLRVSKSAIVNTKQVYSLTKTLTGNLIAFHHSPKQLYASRRYYRQLKISLEQKGLL
ncbi:LytTR family transcriptional regulator [Lactobacillus plantarum]|uniref:LytTR family DNA-binding domain-containing protein n=1 Tax=Lactiplantibacillus plantarum TaxID=1590 RepID=UPI0013D74DA0|nr:LytTR family DNA-binding domain-containing protein [Lactiplantibacillus plantarum]MCT3229971.1 LytTR family transcriptional regulator [Lactiplantibacillus plantarum]NFA48860.1 LytTR family transcriptional regulator [Lactiplantibacillus plantarum]